MILLKREENPDEGTSDEGKTGNNGDKIKGQKPSQGDDEGNSESGSGEEESSETGGGGAPDELGPRDFDVDVGGGPFPDACGLYGAEIDRPLCPERHERRIPKIDHVTDPALIRSQQIHPGAGSTPQKGTKKKENEQSFHGCRHFPSS